MNNTPDSASQADDDESLERLLAGAEWPDPSPDALDRLEAQWHSISPQEMTDVAKPAVPIESRRGRWWLALTAAGLLAVTLLVWKSVRDRQWVQPGRGNSEPGDIASDTDATDDYEFRASRPAHDFEKLAFLLLPNTDSGQPPQSPPDAGESVAELVARLARQNPTSWDSVPPPATTRFRREQQVHQLWQLIQRPGGKQERRIAIQLLRRLGGPQAIQPLLRLVADPRTHDLAVREVAPLLPALQLGRLIQTEAKENLKKLLLTRLLSNGSKQDTDVYLNFVWKRDTRHLALSVIHDHPSPPIEMLFQSIDSPRHRERLLAARALGNVCNPEVSQRLIEMAMNGRRRSEAFLALIGCHDDKALSFLRQAQTHQLYAASLRVAVFQLKSLP